jgi:N-acetylmuramoyl-L-alanine amidase
LQKHNQIAQHYRFNESRLEFIDRQGNVPYSVQLAVGAPPRPSPPSRLRSYILGSRNPTLPLRGLRVALDPGHLGGAMARLERRYIDIGPTPATDNRRLTFNEGDLALQTALALRGYLEAAGATVMITREQSGVAVYPKPFDQWRREDLASAVDEWIAAQPNLPNPEERRQYFLTMASEGELFRTIYNSLDLDARAEKINSFSPQMTLFIHYNVGALNDEQTGQNLGTNDDYCMAFVGGSFAENEIRNQDDLYQFGRLLLSDDHAESVRFATAVVRHIQAVAGVPPVVDTASVPTDYLNRFSMKDAEGVYSRNLALTRDVRGALAYGEALYQDNPIEALALSRVDKQIAGQPISSRVVQIALAYYRAIAETAGAPVR